MIFYAIVIHDPRVPLCNDLDPRSYISSQGDSAQVWVLGITPYCRVGSWQYFIQLLSMTQVCVTTFTQGHIWPRSRLHFTQSTNLFPGHNLLQVTWIGWNKIYVNDPLVLHLPWVGHNFSFETWKKCMILHTLVVLDLGFFFIGGIYPR